LFYTPAVHQRATILTLAAAVLGGCALVPALVAARASTEIEVALETPRSGNITVATAHTKVQRSGGRQLEVTLKEGKRLPKGVSLYARPRKRGKSISVDLVVTRKSSGKSSAVPAGSAVAVLNSPNSAGFKRSFTADEQANVFSLPTGGSKPEGRICDSKGKGRSRLIAGKHVFNRTDAGAVIKDACAAFGGSRSGGAKKLQNALK
jgi:hypothetical protein